MTSKRGAIALSLLLAPAVATAPALATDGLNESAGDGDVFVDQGAGDTDLAYSCAAQTDGKFLIGGTVTTSDSEGHQVAVARIGLDNELDGTFGSGGIKVIDFSTAGIPGTQGLLRAMAIDKEGRVYLGGQFHETAFFTSDIGFVMRLTATGAIDAGWQNGYFNGISYDGWIARVVAMGFDASGRLWAAGPALADGTGAWDYEVYASDGYSIHNGSFDFTAWGPQTSAPSAIAFDPFGKAIIGGWIQRGAPSYLASAALARIDGSTYQPDPTFSYNVTPSMVGRAVFDDYNSSYLRSVALQPDLRIVYAAEDGPLNQESVLVENLDRNGTFGSAWSEYVAFPFGSTSASGGGGLDRMAVQSDGKVVVAAASYTEDPSNITDVGVARLTPTGSYDTPFGGLGTGKVVYDMPPVGALGSDGNDQLTCLTLVAGKPVLVGSGHFAATDWDFSFVRLSNDLIFAETFASGTTFFWSAKSP